MHVIHCFVYCRKSTLCLCLVLLALLAANVPLMVADVSVLNKKASQSQVLRYCVHF